jgi:UDP-N-acetylmuramyl tripeptide synthase
VPADLPFVDSRRLQGGNLYFAGPGAVLETRGIAVDDALLAGWRERALRARCSLGWEARGDDGEATVARRHATGASLALQAPIDQLYTATELNEWALCATLQQRDPGRYANLAAALLEDYLADTADPADVIPPVIEETAALARLARRAAGERSPRLVALLEGARARRLPALLDDVELTLGAGTGARSWPLESLPDAGSVPWSALRAVPIAAVTGTNGKTTTVRLVAACLRAQGRIDGYCCTEGVYVGNEPVATGDWSGPAGARRVLRDARVEAAVLETARGGILRRGLAIQRAEVAVVTNVTSDHFGEYGIDDLDALADVKFTVAGLVRDEGLLVLNAGNASSRARAASLGARLGRTPRIGWFAADYGDAVHAAGAAARAPACGARDGRLALRWHDAEHDLGPVAAMPLSALGAARYNVENLAAAALAAAALGASPAVIASVYAQFGRHARDNSGRLMRFERGGAQVLVDYAHNPDGMRGLLRVAEGLRAPQGRLGLLLGHAGNRLDADIVELARVAMEFAPALVVVKEDEGHLRGRQPGEVPRILRDALLEAGLAADRAPVCPGEFDAARLALEWSRPGDVIVLLLHASDARERVLQTLLR